MGSWRGEGPAILVSAFPVLSSSFVLRLATSEVTFKCERDFYLGSDECFSCVSP